MCWYIVITVKMQSMNNVYKTLFIHLAYIAFFIDMLM